MWVLDDIMRAANERIRPEFYVLLCARLHTMHYVSDNALVLYMREILFAQCVKHVS